MLKLLATALAMSIATPAFSQDKCVTEKDILSFVKQHRMVESRCYWNTDTAQSEEEFQCVRTWVAPDKTYFSVENNFECFVNPRTISQGEMKKLLKVKKPKQACDDCG